MDATTLTIIWILAIGVIVGLVGWFGPRPSQWRQQERQEEPDEAVADRDQPKDDPNPPLT